jgi:hypothetical protein
MAAPVNVATSGHRAAPPPTDDDMDDVLAAIRRRARRLLARRGVLEEPGDAEGDDPWAEREPVRAGLTAASVQGRLALGPRPGAEVRRCGAFESMPPDIAILRRACDGSGSAPADEDARVARSMWIRIAAIPLGGE